MDTVRNMQYRGFMVNDEAVRTQESMVAGNASGSGISGCVVHNFDISDVDVVQYLEKRAEQDGMDAGSVFHGARRIRMSGTLYGLTRALLFDAWMEMRAAFNPVLAQRESPADKGYLPLYFSIPTNRAVDYPSGAIDLMVQAMPRSLQAVTSDDAQGGGDEDSLAIPWQLSMICKDPSITADSPYFMILSTISAVTGVTATAATDLVNKTSHGLVAGDRVTFGAITGGTGLSTGVAYYVIASGLTANAFKVSTTSGGAAVNITVDGTAMTYVKTSTQAGNTVNRGNYIAPLNAIWSVGPEKGSIALTIGDSAFTVNVPASTNTRTIRYNGREKFLTVEELGVEVPRMDLLTFAGLQTHPNIPAGTAAWSSTFSGITLLAGSQMWFHEHYA